VTPELHHEEHEGAGPHALLVHGLLASRAQWHPNLAALSHVTRPVVVDLWGHGRSPAPREEGWYRPQAYVEAFERLRKSLGIDRWLVCGLSLGAALTLRYTFDHPRRVLAQVFTNSVSALADDEWIATMRAGAGAQADRIEREGHAALEEMPIHPRHAKRFPPELRDEIVADARRMDVHAAAMTFRVTVPESSVRARIGENRVPALLVCGRYEERFLRHAEHAARHMPELEVVRADAGHAVNVEAAEEFDRAVTRFFSRVAGERMTRAG
jgi:pimeloyl-ACP methyl ester carboxylesterase